MEDDMANVVQGQQLKQEQEQGVSDSLREEGPNGEEDLEEGEEEEEEEEGETRCVCGEVDPPEESGLYIQCEQCSVWQHGYCVGIGEGEDTRLEKYWCEQCKPELHHLYIEDISGRSRSIYKPVQEKRRHSRRNYRHGKGSGSPAELETGALDIRSADGEQFQEGLPVSTPTGEHGSPTAAIAARQSRGGRPSSKETADTSNAASTYDRTSLHHAENGSEGDVSIDDGRRSQDRQRATFSAREEKQYQLMLEKAIKESRRTSHQDDADPSSELQVSTNPIEHGNLPAEGASLAKTEDATEVIPRDTRSTEISQDNGKNSKNLVDPITLAATTESNDGATVPTPNKQSSHLSQSRSHSSNSTSEDDARRTNGPRRSQRGPKVTKRGKSAGTTKSNSAKNKNGVNGGSKSDIGINKPMKPRLPPQRTSLSEMRRRVSAILEFISRTQWELSEEHSSKDDLVRFVENQQFIDQVDAIYEKYDQSFKLMDDLTRSLLLWEKKYSNNSNVND